VERVLRREAVLAQDFALISIHKSEHVPIFAQPAAAADPALMRKRVRKKVAQSSRLSLKLILFFIGRAHAAINTDFLLF